MPQRTKKPTIRHNTPKTPIDPLKHAEKNMEYRPSGKMHDLSEKPTKPLKRARGHKEKYKGFRK